LRRLCGGLVAEAMWWVAGAIGNKAISASNLVEVEVEVEAELGNRKMGQPSYFTVVETLLQRGTCPKRWVSIDTVVK